MIGLSVFIGIFYDLSFIYFFINIFLGLAIIVLNILLIVKRNKNYSWLLFKISSPYLAIVFLAIVLDILLY